MAKFDYIKTQNTAARLIDSFGQTAVLVRVSSSYDAVTGISTENVISKNDVLVCPLPASQGTVQAFDNRFREDIKKGKIRFFYVAAKDIAHVPESGDKLEFENQFWDIAGSTPLTPGGVDVIYTIGVKLSIEEPVEAVVNADTSSKWVRNPNWLTLPTLTAGVDEEITALVLISDADSNYIAFTLTGDYTVDPGDGNAPINVSSGVAFEYNYDFNQIDLTTSILENGQTVKQVIIRITPQGGSQLNTVNWNVRHSELNVLSNSGIVDVNICAGNLTESKFGLNMTQHSKIERLIVTDIGTVVDASDFYLGLFSLRKINLWDTSNATDISSFFNSCKSLKFDDLPLFDFSNADTGTFFMNGCDTVEALPSYDLSSIRDLFNAFGTCRVLKDVSGVSWNGILSNIRNLFNFNKAIMTIPLMDWGVLSNTSNVLQGADNVRRILATGLRIGIDLSDTQMGATELNEFFTNCGTADGAQTIIVTDTSALTCDPSIATSKGWTVAT